MPQPPAILFTAFEPSGDEHAAPLIEQLQKRHPDIPIYGLGGDRMRKAGTALIEHTTDTATMGLGIVKKVMEHRRRLRHLKQWLTDNPIQLLVPTDSPSANWSICKLVRTVQPQAKIVHLVAPQLWAWAPWRIKRMKRLSDHVICILPFEPDWFAQHNFPATFVGHPVFEGAEPPAPNPDVMARLPEGRIKLALLPGSRGGEIKWNWPFMLETFDALRKKHDGLVAAAAAYSQRIAEHIDWATHRAPPNAVKARDDVAVEIGQVNSILHWADLVLVTSGTATLHVAMHRKPMVAMYHGPSWPYHIFYRWVLTTNTFTLPNLIAEMDGDRAIPEYVPFFDKTPKRIIDTFDDMIVDTAIQDAQRTAFAQIADKFAGHDYATEATDVLRQVAGL